MLLKDKVALITGGAGLNGLGFATARQMAAQGAKVVILDLARADPAGGRRPAGRGPPGPGGRRDRQGLLRAAAAEVLKACGRIDILFNNAGITQPRKTLDITGADYDRGPGRQPARHAVHVAGRDPGDARAEVAARSSASRRCQRAARRRHLRRPALLGGQGRRAGPGARDGARVRHRRHPRQLHHPGPDRDRHQQGPDSRREEGRDPGADPAGPPGRRLRRGRLPACSWPATSRPSTAPASRSTSTAAC
jgi:hypothetical protein